MHGFTTDFVCFDYTLSLLSFYFHLVIQCPFQRVFDTAVVLRQLCFHNDEGCSS